MKGYVTLTDSDIDLFSKAVEVIIISHPNMWQTMSIGGLRK